MKAEVFDQKFNEGENITKYLDLGNIKRPGLEVEYVDIGFPRWMLVALDKEAKKLDTDRNSVIKFWISERLNKLESL